MSWSKNELLTDAQKQIVEKAKRTRAKLVASGVSLEPFKCVQCGEEVRYWIVNKEIKPVAMNVLGEVCYKSDTGFHMD